MAFDPTLPQTNALINSAELRTQFTAPCVVRTPPGPVLAL